MCIFQFSLVSSLSNLSFCLLVQIKTNPTHMQHIRTTLFIFLLSYKYGLVPRLFHFSLHDPSQSITHAHVNEGKGRAWERGYTVICMFIPYFCIIIQESQMFMFTSTRCLSTNRPLTYWSVCIYSTTNNIPYRGAADEKLQIGT